MKQNLHIGIESRSAVRVYWSVCSVWTWMEVCSTAEQCKKKKKIDQESCHSAVNMEFSISSSSVSNQSKEEKTKKKKTDQKSRLRWTLEKNNKTREKHLNT